MTARRWHIAHAGEGVILSRKPGARTAGAGLWAETRLPSGGRPGVLAHEIRKDVWRALRGVRGFSPVVEIQPCREGTGLWVRAGGVLEGAAPAALRIRLSAVLEDAARRRRWIAHAARRQR